MDEKTTDRLFAFGYELTRLIEKWIDRKYPELKVDPNDATVWIKGEKLPEPQSKEAYDNFPSNQPGRFERAIAAARLARDEDNPNS